MWVPADRVAAGLAGLAGVDVEVVALGRDMGETGDIGHVPVPASVADVEFIVGYGAIGAAVEQRLAALDVTDPEPLPPGHELWSLPGVFITPHVAASTPVSRQRAARLVREQAEAYLRGEPLRNVISGAY